MIQMKSSEIKADLDALVSSGPGNEDPVKYKKLVSIIRKRLADAEVEEAKAAPAESMLKIKRAATSKTPGYGEIVMPTGLPAGLSAEKMVDSEQTKKAKRKAATLIASQDPAALEGYADKLIPEYQAAMKLEGIEVAPKSAKRMREDAIRWATEQKPASGLRQATSGAVDWVGQFPAMGAAAAGGLIHNAVRGASKVFGGDYGGLYMAPEDVPAIVSDLQRKQEQTDLQTAAQGQFDKGRDMVSDLGAIWKEFKKDPGEFASLLGEGMMNPRDAFWNVVPMAAPMKLAKVESKAAAAARKVLEESAKTATGEVAEQIKNQLATLGKPSFARRAAVGGTNATAEGALYGTSQELIGQGENARGSDILMNTVMGIPFGLVSDNRFGAKAWDAAGKLVDKGVGLLPSKKPKRVNGVAVGQFDANDADIGELGTSWSESASKVDAEAKLKVDEENTKKQMELEAALMRRLEDELLNDDISPWSKAITDRIKNGRAAADAAIRGDKFDQNAIIAGKQAEVMLERIRASNPELFAELDAKAAERTAKAQAIGSDRVYTAADELALTEAPNATTEAKPKTKEQIAKEKAALRDARLIYAIPESINDIDFGKMTDAQLRKAMAAQFKLESAGESMDGVKQFGNIQQATKARDAARQKTAPPDETEIKRERTEREKAESELRSALDVFGMRRAEGKQFAINSERAKKIRAGLKVDDGRLSKRLADEGYSPDEISELELLADNTDSNSDRAIEALLNRKPLWAAPDMDRVARVEETQRKNNNRERAQAIGETLDAWDTEDALNADLDQQAQQTLQGQTDRVIASEGQRVPNEEAAAMNTAEQDLGDNETAKRAAERDEEVAVMIKTMSEPEISAMLLDMIRKNPTLAKRLWLDPDLHVAARAASKVDSPVSAKAKRNLSEALKKTAADVKKMGRLPKGF
jgi:hypothetical protein